MIQTKDEITGTISNRFRMVRRIDNKRALANTIDNHVRGMREGQVLNLDAILMAISEHLKKDAQNDEKFLNGTR